MPSVVVTPRNHPHVKLLEVNVHPLDLNDRVAAERFLGSLLDAVAAAQDHEQRGELCSAPMRSGSPNGRSSRRSAMPCAHSA